VPSSDDIKLDSRMMCLFKGDPGSGKSIAAASYPNPYFFDLDDRMKSVAHYWRARNRKFMYDTYTSFDPLYEKLEQFETYCPYETLIYDGITSGGDQILNDMVSFRSSTNAKKVMRGKRIEQYQIEDYGGEGRGLQMIVDKLKAISRRRGIHVIVTAHVLTTESTDLKTKQTTTSRTLLTAGKKVAAKLPKDFDESYHFDVQPGFSPDDMPKYTIVTRNTGWDWAKTALPIPLRIDFTNGSLYDIIMGHLEGHEFVRPVNDPGTPPASMNTPVLSDF